MPKTSACPQKCVHWLTARTCIKQASSNMKRRGAKHIHIIATQQCQATPGQRNHVTAVITSYGQSQLVACLTRNPLSVGEHAPWEGVSADQSIVDGCDRLVSKHDHCGTECEHTNYDPVLPAIFIGEMQLSSKLPDDSFRSLTVRAATTMTTICRPHKAFLKHRI